MIELNREPADAGASVASAEADRYCIIVDDDPGICRALSFTMRKLGFETDDAASPQELDDKLSGRNPQLVFLDLGLGDCGALDVLPVLERHGYKGFVQLMSGRSRDVLDEIAAAGERHGLRMLEALPKPFRMGVVKELVAHLDQAA